MGITTNKVGNPRVQFQVELGRHVPTHVVDQQGEPSVQDEEEIQPESNQEQGVSPGVSQPAQKHLPRGVALQKSKRTIRKPVRYGFDNHISYALVAACEAPETYQEAMESPEKEWWKQAMDEEMSEKSDITAGRFDKECSCYRLKVDLHQEGSTWRTR